MKKINLLLIIILFISCNNSVKNNEISQEIFDKINKWYYSSSPVFNVGDEIRLDNAERKKLEEIVKIKRQIPDKFDIVHQERFLSEIDNKQLTIKVIYYCKAKDESVAIVSDTYYYDDDNTPLPILVKSVNTMGNNYSLIERF